jgi:hypothetical protein
MSKRPRVTAAARPSAWAQVLFAGSVLFAGLSLWLLITL